MLTEHTIWNCLDNCFTELVLEKKLILKEIDDNQAVFLSTFYYTELNIARMLLELNISTPEDDYILGSENGYS